MYDLPPIKNFGLIISVIILSAISGFFAGLISVNYFTAPEYVALNNGSAIYSAQTSQEQAVIDAVQTASKAVVSIIVSKDLPIFEEYYVNPFREFREFFGPDIFPFQIPQYRQKGTERREIGGGTGFIVSEGGMILTNAHVVADEEAEYTVLTNDGKKYSAEVLARDTFRDLAVIKVQNAVKFPTLNLGDSDNLQIGQTVVAIGNALGEFRNTVSVGVISGLGRQITAEGGGTAVTLEDIIQTDAAINRGNSGGPLLNLKGEVIGINFAMAETAQSIGFAIPVNKAKISIEQVKTFGKIVYPFLGVRYALITETIQKENNLPVDYGAWLTGSEGEPAIFPGSAAEKAGLKENDIILELNGEKITTENTLAKLIMEYSPDDQVSLKILREGREFTVEVILGQKSE